MLPEKAEAPLVLDALRGDQSGKRLVMLMRSGRVRAVDTRRTERELLASLPSSELKQEFSSAYVECHATGSVAHTRRFDHRRAGEKHPNDTDRVRYRHRSRRLQICAEPPAAPAGI